ncbi:MAG: hypothetical protein G01um101433_682 [Parcubacteria group bacterium Gr01-1014_33]|nr:MAG: hypothetical protein G01um101433_682 [Parcubacteria group bacterium Gr01-1014_33]
MVFDIFLGIIFAGSSMVVWSRISRKFPHLASIPDHVITERLHRDATKFRLFLIYFKSFYKEEFFHDILRGSASKVGYKIHILLMRMDNGVVRLLRKVRVNGNGARAPNSAEETPSTLNQNREEQSLSTLQKTEKEHPFDYSPFDKNGAYGNQEIALSAGYEESVLGTGGSPEKNLAFGKRRGRMVEVRTVKNFPRIVTPPAKEVSPVSGRSRKLRVSLESADTAIEDFVK